MLYHTRDPVQEPNPLNKDDSGCNGHVLSIVDRQLNFHVTQRSKA